MGVAPATASLGTISGSHLNVEYVESEILLRLGPGCYGLTGGAPRRVSEVREEIHYSAKAWWVHGWDLASTYVLCLL